MLSIFIFVHFPLIFNPPTDLKQCFYIVINKQKEDWKKSWHFRGIFKNLDICPMNDYSCLVIKGLFRVASWPKAMVSIHLYQSPPFWKLPSVDFSKYITVHIALYSACLFALSSDWRVVVFVVVVLCQESKRKGWIRVICNLSCEEKQFMSLRPQTLCFT